ncbi:MAG: hypothetical protein IJ723_02620, partial [Ruminococcus sp.]|nr:hypothetical protein [Ruminococcus sp.]
MLKRIIAAICALCLTAAVLSGCASSDKKETDRSAADSAEASGSEAEAKEQEPEFELDPTPVTRTENVMPDLDGVKKQYSEKEADIAKQLEALAADKDAPCINITTEDDAPIVSKETYVASVVDVFNCGDEFRLSAAGGVKVRGNSSADQGDEKPYRIKFEDKHNMLGLHGGS